MCNSEFNRQSAHLFAQCTEEVLHDLEAWGLSKLRASLLQTRTECIQRCLYVANIIHPCLRDRAALLDPTLPLPLRELTLSKASCCTVLKRLLYAPCLSPRSLSTVKLLCEQLYLLGHAEEARVLWLYVAAPSSAPPACVLLPAKRLQCNPSMSA